MKKILLVMFLFQSAIYAQESTEIEVNDDLVIEESNFRNFNGSLFVKNDAVYLNTTECDFIGKETVKLNLDEKKAKEWKKKISKNDNAIPEATIVGVYNAGLIDVKKIKTPFTAPKKPSGAPNVDTYVAKVFEMYAELKRAREEANYIKIVSKEENDAKLGLVTSNTYYDSECKELNQEQLVKLKPKALSSTLKTLDFLGDLLLRQTQLSTLSTAAAAELQTLTGFTILSATKNYSNAKLVSSAVFLEIPKVIANVNKSKTILEQLKNE